MAGYIGTSPVPQATQTRDVFTATSGQTSFATSGYTPNFLDVWLNGVKLINGDDFTATNGSDVVLTTGATAGDTVEVLAFSTFEVKSQTFTGTTTFTGDVALGDNVKAVFGDGSDLEISHTGSFSLIQDNGTGNLIVSGSNLQLQNAARNRNYLQAIDAGGVTIFSGGDPKLATTSDGIDVTGNITLTGGVYLGGTGAANLLDDYEEGTWTPTLLSSDTLSVTYNSAAGSYTKVGRLVVANFDVIANVSVSSGVGWVSLPFTPNSSDVFYHGAVIRSASLYGNLGAGEERVGYTETSGFQIQIMAANGNESNTSFSIGSGLRINAWVAYYTS